MDWDTLIPKRALGTAETGANESKDGAGWEQFPPKTGACSHYCRGGESNPNNSLSNLFPLFPLFPRPETRLGLEGQEKAPWVAGRPDQIRARNEGGQRRFPLHPAGVVLCLAWCDVVGADADERAAALEAMTTTPPAEQVKQWHGVCVAQGLKPWELIYTKAPAEGTECGNCKHLTSREYRHLDERRRFHWACALGYLLHEYGSGSERVWIAPPECESWERWYPSDQR
jgi:hypothetical protein